MKKLIKNYSVIVMTVLLITGCGAEKSTLSTVSAFLSEAEPSNSTISETPTSTAPTTLSTPIPVTSLSPTAKPSTYIAPEVSSSPSEEPKTLSTPLPTPVPSITATPSPVPSNPTVVITNNININQPVNVNGTNNNNLTTTPTQTPTPIISNSPVPTAIPTTIPVALITPVEIKPIVPDQKTTSIVGVYYPEGDSHFSAGIRHIFRLKNGKRSHYLSIGSILADNFNEEDIVNIDYNTFINNFIESSSIYQPSFSIKKELSSDPIYLVIESSSSGDWGKYKRRFSNPQTLELYMNYLKLSPEIVPDGSLSTIPQGKDIIRL